MFVSFALILNNYSFIPYEKNIKSIKNTRIDDHSNKYRYCYLGDIDDSFRRKVKENTIHNKDAGNVSMVDITPISKKKKNYKSILY